MGKAPLLLCQAVGAAAKYLPTYTSCVVSALRDNVSDRWLKLGALNSLPGPLNTLKLTCTSIYTHTHSKSCLRAWRLYPASTAELSLFETVHMWLSLSGIRSAERLLVPLALYLYRPELCTVLSYSHFLRCHQKTLAPRRSRHCAWVIPVWGDRRIPRLQHVHFRHLIQIFPQFTTIAGVIFADDQDGVCARALVHQCMRGSDEAKWTPGLHHLPQKSVALQM